MTELFHDVLCPYVLVFFNEILVYSSSLDHHYQHLEQVFIKFGQHSFYAKSSKCTFAVDTSGYLGHIIYANGVQADPEKLVAIQKWPRPTNLTNLRVFLGLTRYYRRFVPRYATIASGLIDLLRKPSFTWTSKANTTFQSLKAAMTTLVTLTLPNFTKPFEVTTDASAIAIGVVLSREDKPIAFFNKCFCPCMQVASTYVRELSAITEAVKKWHQYLIGCKFLIFTDQHSLKHLLSQVVQIP